MKDLHIDYRIGLSSISNIIREVCASLWSRLKSACFPPLTKEFLAKSAEEFEARANFPNCVAAIDGKHIRMIKPAKSGSMNFNYKHYFSVLLLAACDSQYKFLYINVGAPGKSSDSTIFKNSKLYSQLKSGQIKMPPPRTISESRPTTVPYFLIGDEGFGLCDFLIRPFAGKYLPIGKKIFNYRLTRARRYIECTFGILSNKWRIFHRPLNVDEDLTDSIVKTCCLHNFVRERDGYQLEDTITVEGLVDNMAPDNSQPGNADKSVPTVLTDYFLNEGQLQWQMDKI
ncbi:hypothetical protein PPYR_06578 [Photinus pyralis]|uniref:DDE Tnp4 domain-containing protein n=1 Tax=Photinus pyralis TaxID=7054 RepID=A0A5N4AU44_PHOPY|nr:hypothetical protein PPYR_06578 [Photinus pyralis]